MKQSFQQKLLNLILEHGTVTYDEMVAFCASEHHKVETLARKMCLVVESGNVEKYPKTGAIKGWRAKRNSETVMGHETINLYDIQMMNPYKPVEPKQPTLFS